MTKEKYTGPRVTDTETFIQKARWVHGDKYDYSKVEYRHSKEKVRIVCPEHGEWEQKAESHTVYAKGCEDCFRERLSKSLVWDTEKCINEFRKVHGDFYDYSKVEYVRSNVNVIIVCPVHGEFTKTPSRHIHRKSGCSKCQGYGLTTKEWVDRFKTVHGNKYNYDKFIFQKALKKSTITCPKHGDFTQTPNGHCGGRGCPSCKIDRIVETHAYSFMEFIEIARSVHGGKYKYVESSYVNASSDVVVECKLHGRFIQNANSHLYGRGCPKCGLLSRSEKRRLGKDEFVERSLIAHDNFYTYDDVEYKNVEEKVVITCPKHGNFLQTPHSHLDGRGCHSCAKDSRDVLCGYGLNGYYGTEKPSNLYVLKLNDSFIKVGLAKEIHSRMNTINKESGYSVEKLYSISGKANELFELEQRILRHSGLTRYYPEVSFGGQSECLELTELPKVLEIIKEFEKSLDSTSQKDHTDPTQTEQENYHEN